MLQGTPGSPSPPHLGLFILWLLRKPGKNSTMVSALNVILGFGSLKKYYFCRARKAVLSAVLASYSPMFHLWNWSKSQVFLGPDSLSTILGSQGVQKKTQRRPTSAKEKHAYLISCDHSPQKNPPLLTWCLTNTFRNVKYNNPIMWMSIYQKKIQTAEKPC